MNEMLAEEILRRVDEATALYHRLVIVVAPQREGKTTALRAVSRATGAPLINVGLELSQRLLELTTKQRLYQVPRILDAIADATAGALVLLDNLEVLFDSQLRVDPLRLLLGLARRRTIVAAWNGRIEQGKLCYAQPGHPERRAYPVKDFLIVEAATPTVNFSETQDDRT
ncbi:MAG TPA: BREX-3 system P-loop-containing protein BrxF [Pirellulales bacterium]|nr:BREX-3 system P-loop-containing protein BrxF [Pirellulales bacterium]